MLISHKHKFIFIKTFKTASTATEVSVSRYLEENDVVGELASEYEEVRKKFAVFPRNHRMNGRPVPAHATARELKAFVGCDIWSRYLKITTERHPYDRLLSHFYHYKQEGILSQESFNEFILSPKWYDARNINKDRLMIGMSWAPDIVMKFENLNHELSLTMKALGIPFDGWLPVLRQGQKKNLKLLTADVKKKIVSENEIIFEKLNYET